MLKIKIEGRDLDVVPNNNFDLEIYNSMIAFEAPQASKAMAITLADSPNNRHFMKHAAHPQVRQYRRHYQGDIYNQNSIIDSGYFYLRSSLDKYEFDYTSNIREFFGAYQSRPLSEIDFGTTALPTNLSDTLAPAWFLNNGYVLPTVKNPAFYQANAPATFNNLINEYTTAYAPAAPLVPMFGLKYTIQKIATLAGVALSGAFWNDPRTDKLILYNTRQVATTTIEPRLHLPNFTIAQLINGLRKTFNLWLRFDIQQKTLRLDYANTIHNGLCTVDWSKYMPQIKSGTLNTAAGIELSWLIDTDNQFHKDPFFLPYLTPQSQNIDNGELLKIQSVFSPLQTDGGLPSTKQFGITPDQGDKKYVPALLSWQGLTAGQPLATNQFGATNLAWPELFTAFWVEEEKFRQTGYRINQAVALPPSQTARMASILRGQSDELPIIHANGTNYLIEKLVTPSQISNISQITAIRM